MELVRYDNARRALAEYKTVDEVKDFRDKAVAVEAYAKQANDFTLERDAAIARVRAERKCGELLRDMEKAKGVLKQGTHLPQSSDATTGAKTLSEMGVTKDQSSKWQKLANIPEDEFEKAIDIPGAKPTTVHLLNEQKPRPKQMDKDALWWWGRLIEMKEDRRLKTSLNDLLQEMTPAMQNDMESLLPELLEYINEYQHSYKPRNVSRY